MFTYNSKTKSQFDPIYEQLRKRYRNKNDPWGLDLNWHRKFFEIVWWFYTYYFRVRVFNKERIQNRPYIVIANHSGQIAIDALLVMMTFLNEVSPPRILRAMIERFLPKLPFVGEWVLEIGSVLGDRKNCTYLLKQGESILVFPEGLQGIAKSTSQFYKLQHFSSGFFKMAEATGVDILPIAVVGAEEFYPYVFHMKSLAQWLRLPALPVTPSFLPLPSPVDIYIGEPISVSRILKEKNIEKNVEKIKTNIQEMVHEGLKKRRGYFG